MTDPTPPATPLADAAALDAAVDEAVASCGGDLRATVRAMVVALDAYQAELEALRCEVGRIRAVVSPGYVRGRLGRGSHDET